MQKRDILLLTAELPSAEDLLRFVLTRLR
jgi:hypothetical protein